MKKITLFAIVAYIGIMSPCSTAQNISETISRQLNEMVEQNRLLPEDVQWRITSESVSRTSGVHHVYFKQILNDLEIYGTDSGIHILPNGEVLFQDTKFVKSATEKLSSPTSPGLSAAQAVEAAAS